MNKKNWTLWIIVVAALIIFALWARHRIHFQWHVFAQQLRLADWKRISLAIGFIWIAYGLRALRWSIFLRPTRRVSPFALIGSMVIGFTGVALFGRLADLVRPYLVSRRTQIPLSAQIAVYTVERMFDMGSMALIFSTVLLFSPDRHSLPRPDLINKAALAGLLVAVFLALFTAFVRASGKIVARLMGRAFGLLSKNMGHQVEDKILSFRDGLNAISSIGDLLMVVIISLIHWSLIAFAYLETARAFVASPILANLHLSQCMLLMAASMGSSLVTLPVLGWFTQIGLTTATMQKLFQVPWEPALGCGSVLLLVTFLSVIPIGLIWARFEQVSLRKVAHESEHAGETIAAQHEQAQA
ncbi:MAG TPA: lysylphosphatidylglycerol synthase transmembrane domain-containing protein [Alloacidobacterium sp.]|nr:lysylphosphatidylglycerol synthase transmembrane domain-containing protein [Alloacidobacterium sp.]